MPLIAVGVVIVLFIVLLSVLTNNYSLNNIKSKTVGDGQHGTARWATTQEVKKTFANVPFDVASWRTGKNLPEVQGLILGSTQRSKQLDALVDRDDVHCLMIGAYWSISTCTGSGYACHLRRWFCTEMEFGVLSFF